MSHDHAHGKGSNETSLRWALLLTTSFLVVEVIGGLLSGSLALISDAAHMFTDAAALGIALIAIQIGKRPADSRRTFGYYRFEILAAALNAVLLFLVAIYIVVEAYRRFVSPQEISSSGMLLIALIGLGVNLLSMRLLAGGKEESLNVKGAYLEVWSDMLGSVGVIIGALIIHFTGWIWVDSIIAIGIGLWVLPRTWRLLRESMNVLLEGVPEGLLLDDVDQAIRAVPGVRAMHDLHIWSISSGKPSLTAHILTGGADVDPYHVTQAVCAMLAERFEIHHSTIQAELEDCDQAADAHSYTKKEDHHAYDH